MKSENRKIKIVFTGPESSGKTTLARLLSEQLPARYVPEFARIYLQWLGRAYTHQDLFPMLRGQQAWEHWAETHSPDQWIVCDTDWTVIRIWELFKYDEILVTPQLGVEPHTHYFLCQPDFPWAPDPLREHPEQREALFHHYYALLKANRASFTLLQGAIPDRLEQIHKALVNLQQ